MAGRLPHGGERVSAGIADYRYVDAGPDWATGGAVGTGRRNSRRARDVRWLLWSHTFSRVARERCAAQGDMRTMAERVAVIGAGQMGNGIAHVFAQNGFDVTMIDVSAERARARQATRSRRISIGRSRKGTLQPRDKDAILGRVAHAQSIDAVTARRSSSKRRRKTATSSSRSSPTSTRPPRRTRFSRRTRARSRSPRSRRAPSGPRTSSACTS